MKTIISKDEPITARELKIIMRKLDENIETTKLLNHHTEYKSGFLVSKASKLIPVDICKVAFFYIKNELVMVYTEKNETYMTDYSLDKLEEEVNPHDFYRANRQFLINRRIVKEVEKYFARKLLVKCHVAAPEPIIISKAKATDFTKWLGGKH